MNKALEEALNGEYCHEIFNGVRNYILDEKCKDLGPDETIFNRINQTEKKVVIVAFFIWEVTNGGISQFLTNSSGDLFSETLTTMKEIDALEATQVLEAVKKTIFEGGSVPKDRSDRCDIVFKWEEDEKRSSEFYSAHDLEWCETVEVAIARYILKNKHELK